MQPNGHFRNCLIGIFDESNITITGGFLHGDREEHDYNSGFVDSDGATGPTNEWVHCMRIKGGKNVVIDGVTFLDATGDGISISSINHFFQDNHIRSSNITIKNSHFLRARRTNIVITSADDVIIENNRIEDGGIDMEKSEGVAPSSNLNIESFRSFDDQGNVTEYERVSRVFIRNNTQIVNDKEANPRAGNFQISHAVAPIIIEDNEMINSGVSFFTADGVEIKNNTITQGGITAGDASNFGRADVIDNIVSGNTVVTDGTALNVAGNGVEIIDNDFEGNVGASFGSGATDSSKGASNIVFKDNRIKAGSRGILTRNTMQNVTIENNEIHMFSGAPFALALENEWEDTSSEANFIFKNNTITGENPDTERGAPANLIKSSSITIEDNRFGELEFLSSQNMTIINNKIEARVDKSGMSINGELSNTIFDSNEITIYPSLTNLSIECVKIKEGVTLPASINFDNQECVEK